jgi:hypothetical protein
MAAYAGKLHHKAINAWLLAVAISALSAQVVLAAPLNAPSQSTSSQSGAPLSIAKLINADDDKKYPTAGLGDDLIVVLNTTQPLDSTQFALFLDGQEIKGLDDTNYDAIRHALVFHLKRVEQNQLAWNGLLGAPLSLTRQVSVSLGQRPSDAPTARPTMIASDNAKQPTFTLVILSPGRLIIAAVADILLIFLVLGGAKRSALLRDNLLPQIKTEDQTFSLGRCQMAFWFTLIFVSYVFLYFILGDANVLNQQALMLMGISGTTALAAVVVDANKDTPSDAVNAALRAIGINSYADILRIQAEIASRMQLLAASPPPATADKLKLEIADRQLQLQTYEENVQPFRSQNWFSDITTDLNGTALHRLQVVCWTALLGAIFLFEVWRDLSMPQFSATLLALMAISGAGYVGFKYPETQH